jgi:tetratricopeptide (TPR) repeat protein
MKDLNAEELFHLALKTGDRDKSISYLKRSIELAPAANSVYMLAAEYAASGMKQRAIALMQQALELNPELWTAYFQLGLLFLTQNLVAEARTAFAPLLQPGPDEYLFHFGNGMTQLIDEQPEAALESLKSGLTINHSNPALNRDVTSIIAFVSAGLGAEADAGSMASATPTNSIPTEINSDAQATENAATATKTQKQYLFSSNYDNGNDGSS